MPNHDYSRRLASSEEVDYWGYNPYYNPEKCGLEQVAFAEAEPNYDFDMLLVVRDVETGKLFAAMDSGCSCPTPFEDYTDLSDFTLINEPEDLDTLFASNYSSIPKMDYFKVRREVKEALRA